MIRLTLLNRYQAALNDGVPAAGGMPSRNALRQFKAANGLPSDDDIWDVATERALTGRRGGSEARFRHVPRSL